MNKSDRKIWLYHEQLEGVKDGTLVPITRQEFEERLESFENYTSLFEQDVLRENCTAVLVNTNVVLSRFCSVTKHTFHAIEGVVEKSAQDIMDELKREGILEDKESSPHTVNFGKLKNHKLVCYPQFQSEFESCIEKDLRYLSCLQKLKSQPPKQLEIELNVMPWLELWEDLVDIGCIKPTYPKANKLCDEETKK